jgi:hypothetical protein
VPLCSSFRIGDSLLSVGAQTCSCVQFMIHHCSSTYWKNGINMAIGYTCWFVSTSTELRVLKSDFLLNLFNLGATREKGYLGSVRVLLEYEAGVMPYWLTLLNDNSTNRTNEESVEWFQSLFSLFGRFRCTLSWSSILVWRFFLVCGKRDILSLVQLPKPHGKKLDESAWSPLKSMSLNKTFRDLQ